MSEKRIKTDGRLATALVAATLLVPAVAGCGGQQGSENRPALVKTPDAKKQPPKFLGNIHGLVEGGKLNKVTIFNPESNKEMSRSYMPVRSGDAEDLVVIYSPKLSREMAATVGIHDDKVGFAYVLSTLPGAATESLVQLNPKTEEVIDVSPPVPLPSGRHIIDPTIFPSKLIDFNIYVEPINGVGESPGIKVTTQLTHAHEHQADTLSS